VAIRRCPYCKAIIDESQKYCNNCGTQLLFSEDGLAEEPIKGEKIVDEDFPEDNGLEKSLDSAESASELEEIDLEAVLSGSEYFPGEAKPASETVRNSAETIPQEDIRPAGEDNKTAEKTPRRASRAGRKTPPAKSKAEADSDTKDEIARLIAALDDKEKTRSRTAESPDGDEPVIGPSQEAEEIVGQIAAEDDRPEAASPKYELGRPAAPKDDEDELPISMKLDEVSDEAESPAAFRMEKLPEPDDLEPAFEAPVSSFTPGDTVDFQNEVLARTPLMVPPPTRPPDSTLMGVPERITREDLFLPLDGKEEAPEIRFGDGSIPSLPAAPATSEISDDEEPRQRLGIFRKSASVLFDFLFVGALWFVSFWLASLLMATDTLMLIEAAKIPAGLFLTVLLGSYFFLFLFFLGETLGDRIVSPRE